MMASFSIRWKRSMRRLAAGWPGQGGKSCD
jgi:hypothetical protein